MNEHQNVFERQLAEWGSRPATTPAELASHRIARRLPERRRPVAWWPAAAAAAVLAGVMLAGWRTSPTRTVPVRDPLREGFLPVGGDTIAWVVDSETTILFTLELHDVEKGQRS